jgi:hypothetical protein
LPTRAATGFPAADLPAGAATAFGAGAKASLAAGAATSFAAALSGFAAGFTDFSATFDFGAVFGFEAVGLLLAAVLLPLAGFAAGRFAGVRLLAAGFLPGVFAAGLRAAALPLVAGRDLRAGFTCFFAMVILVR